MPVSHDQNFKNLILDYPLLAEWPDGRREALLFVVEQQTRASGFSPHKLARINLPNMRWPRAMKLDIYANATRGLMELEPDPDRQLKYVEFIDIYTALDDNERALFEQRYRQEDSDVAGFAERFTNIGIEKGLETGRACEARTILSRLLVRRFGPLPTAIEDRIQRADVEQLESWADQVLDARSLDELFPV